MTGVLPASPLREFLFLKERRRLKIIPDGFREKPVLKFMLRALIRAAERRLAELFCSICAWGNPD
jgi:hypothetical protein